MTSVLVLAGGLTVEREVSLRSGRRAVDALRAAGVEAELADVDAGLLPALGRAAPDAVVIALHGGPGEDGSVRAVLDLAGIRYVGSPAAACRGAFDKPTAKAIVRSAGLPTPDWVALPHETVRELGSGAVLDRVVAGLGLPLMVKPARGGSALGVSVVSDADALPAAMVACFAYDETALVERRVAGTEVAVSVVDRGAGAVALPAVEVVPPHGLFDYAARYTAGTTEYHTPARLPEPVLARCAEVAVGAHLALGLRDLSRTDLIVDDDGEAWFLEVNVAPGMTETSLLPMACAAAGEPLGEVLRALAETAAQRR
jgi:D-alanine-D-alanine ligase